MQFDRTQHTLKAKTAFQRGALSKEKGQALSKAEMAELDDDGVRHLVEIAQVAEPTGLDTEAAKAAEEATAPRTAPDKPIEPPTPPEKAAASKSAKAS